VDEVTRGLGNSFGVTSFGGIGFASTVALILALLFTLRPGERAKARLPLALLALHLLFVALEAAIPERAVASRPVAVLATFLLLTAAARTVFLLVVEAVFAGRLGRPLPKILRDILQAVTLLFVVLATLRSAGVEPGSLLTTSALLTAVVGLSLQDTLGNLFAGLSIQVQTPFEIGDWIGSDDQPRNVGRVIEINWRATKVITHEEIEIIIPNGTLAKTRIRNFSKPSPFTRRTVEVGCAYESPPDRVREVILASLEGAPDVLTEPAPTVALAGFGESGVEYEVYFYVTSFGRRFAIESTVRERVWYALRRAKIAIPYPTRELHMVTSSEESRAAVRAEEDAARVRLLRKVDFLAVLPDAAIARLASLTEPRVYGPGEVIIRQGDAGDELFVVVRGHVSVLVGRAGGSVAELTRLGPGAFFGELSLITGERRTATVRAVLQTELLAVGKAAFSEILTHAPELAETIVGVLTHRQVELDEHLQERADKAQPEAQAEAVALVERVRKFFQL